MIAYRLANLILILEAIANALPICVLFDGKKLIMSIA